MDAKSKRSQRSASRILDWQSRAKASFLRARIMKHFRVDLLLIVHARSGLFVSALRAGKTDWSGDYNLLGVV
jgi:hypothetical protein